MKYIWGIIFLVPFVLWSQKEEIDLETELNFRVDAWHQAAAEVDSSYFFGMMADDCVYIGTAPEERWTKAEFYNFAIPYFRRGRAWDFKPLQRHWNFNKKKDVAWFDETLDTWMLDCQSTGVLEKIKGEWKIVHYQLSVLIENEKIKSFIELRKSDQENE